jgi:hypothetical protein
MSSLKRRHFLQFAGSTLAAIGLSQIDFLSQADRYARVLAQGTPRKLALLVGINTYPTLNSLQGCLTDVMLQRELLTYRYGFNPNDIVTLSSDASSSDLLPSRANILHQFENHLIKQAQPGDVVVFHYSGHGSRVKDPDPIADACPEDQSFALTHPGLNGTLVPQDALATGQNGSDIEVPDIMGRTLFLLMRAINTDNLTVVLDSCFSGGGTRGNVIVRSLADRTAANKILVPNPEEREYQQQWMSKLSLNEAELRRMRQQGIARGVAIGSALCNQEALDAPFENFHAGAFTYLLTRYLWQLPDVETTNAIQINLSRSTQILTDSLKRYEQAPKFYVAPDRGNEQKPFYFLSPATNSAEAVITNTSGDTIEFWLGGVSTQNLNSTNTVFTVVDQAGKPVLDQSGKPIEIQQQSRVEPLYGHGKLRSGQLNQIKPGLLLREKIVGLPDNPTLKVGLDPSLGNDLSTVKAALQSSSWIEPIAVNQQTHCDCLIGRMTSDYQKKLTAAGKTDLPAVNTIGLFSPDLSPLSNDLFGAIAEPATAAVERLRLRLEGLLVAQFLRALATTSSNLQVNGEIFAADRSGPRIAIGSRGVRSTASGLAINTQAFRAGSPIKISITNQETKPLYLSSLIIKEDGSLKLLYPANWLAPEEEPRIENSLTIPRPEDGINLVPQGAGYVELLVLVSTAPLRNVLRALQTIASRGGTQRGILSVGSDDSFAVLGHLLNDIGSLSRGASGDADIAAQSSGAGDRRSLDTNTLAAFSTVIEVK